MPVTIHDVATFRLGREPANERDLIQAEMNSGGACESCGTELDARTAHPSRSGYWRCGSCIGARGFETAAEAEREIFEPDPLNRLDSSFGQDGGSVQNRAEALAQERVEEAVDAALNVMQEEYEHRLAAALAPTSPGEIRLGEVVLLSAWEAARLWRALTPGWKSPSLEALLRGETKDPADVRELFDLHLRDGLDEVWRAPADNPEMYPPEYAYLDLAVSRLDRVFPEVLEDAFPAP